MVLVTSFTPQVQVNIDLYFPNILPSFPLDVNLNINVFCALIILVTLCLIDFQNYECNTGMSCKSIIPPDCTARDCQPVPVCQRKYLFSVESNLQLLSESAEILGTLFQWDVL